MSNVDYSKTIVKPALLLKGKACFAQVHDVTMIVSDIPKWSNELVLEYLNEMTKVVAVYLFLPASRFFWAMFSMRGRENYRRSGWPPKDFTRLSALR